MEAGDQGSPFRLSLVNPKFEAGTKIEKVSVINHALAILAVCYRRCCLASWIVTGASTLAPGILT